MVANYPHVAELSKEQEEGRRGGGGEQGLHFVEKSQVTMKKVYNRQVSLIVRSVRPQSAKPSQLSSPQLDASVSIIIKNCNCVLLPFFKIFSCTLQLPLPGQGSY
jgi:hypothetical protein